jgi:predicted nucleic acid-binding protein
MRLLDSNILIYATQTTLLPLVRPLLTSNDSLVSEITRLEALGYHKLSEGDKHFLETTFSTMTILPITQAVIDKAIELRQQKRMSAGDAIHAATALLHNLELHTRNTQDFSWINGLKVVNPIPLNP